MRSGSIERSFRVMSALLAIAITVVLVFLTYLTTRLEATSEEERLSSRVVSYTSFLQLRTIDIETAQRGYVLTGSEEFLTPYGNAIERIETITPGLRDFVQDDPKQRKRIEAVIADVNSYVDDFAEPNIALAKRDREAAREVVASESGKRRVDALRAQFTEIIDVERARRDQRAEESASLATQAQFASGAAIIVVLLALGLFVVFIGRTLVRPLRELRDVVRRIAEGDLTARPTRTYRGEAAELAEDVGTMAGALFAAQADLERRAQEIQEHAQALERSNADLEQFAYAAAHDLQEPLRMVASYTSLIERRYKGQLDDDADEFIRYAVDGAKRMQRLINDLLTYSRVNSSTASSSNVDIDDAAQEALANLQARVNERGATVDVQVADDAVVFGQRGQVVMLLQNLLGNALRFAGDDTPTVQLQVQVVDDRIVAWVDDDGPGIEPEYHERVFRIFQRLGARDEHAGTGIGLALCRRIVERHGGEIHVETAPIGGARFHFELPASSPTGSMPHPASLEAST